MSAARSLFSLLVVAVALAAGACSRPCAMMAERQCACDQRQAPNRRACELAREEARRAEGTPRGPGAEPQRSCREALRFFRCPSVTR